MAAEATRHASASSRATGAVKGSVLWSAVRAMLPLLPAGLVQMLAYDPKLMELAFGRPLFDRYGRDVVRQLAIDHGCELAFGPCSSAEPGRGCAGRSSRPRGAPSPLDPAPPEHTRHAAPQDGPPLDRQDLHHARRQDLPAVAVRHADLPELPATRERDQAIVAGMGEVLREARRKRNGSRSGTQWARGAKSAS